MLSKLHVSTLFSTNDVYVFILHHHKIKVPGGVTRRYVSTNECLHIVIDFSLRSSSRYVDLAAVFIGNPSQSYPTISPVKDIGSYIISVVCVCFFLLVCNLIDTLQYRVKV